MTTFKHSYPMLQCAAVSTQYLWTNDPPQKCWPLVLCKDTMYLMEFGAAVCPPTMRPCMNTWPVWKQKHLQDKEIQDVQLYVYRWRLTIVNSFLYLSQSVIMAPTCHVHVKNTHESSFELSSNLLNTQNILQSQLPRYGFQSLQKSIS